MTEHNLRQAAGTQWPLRGTGELRANEGVETRMLIMHGQVLDALSPPLLKGSCIVSLALCMVLGNSENFKTETNWTIWVYSPKEL